MFTDLPLETISGLEALPGSEINAAKVALANAATALCRGEAAAMQAEATARTTFEQGGAGDDLPTIIVQSDTITLIDALTGLGLVASKGEARRLIKGGGARIDGVQASDEAALVSLNDGHVRISAGKKLHGIVKRG